MKKNTTDTVYNGLSINTNEEKGLACQTQVLDKHRTHLEDMIDKHSKVMQVRFDMRYPADGSVVPDRQHLHDFNYNFQRTLKREQIAGGHKVDPRLTVVTERHESEHPHMHAILLVNGNAKQNYFPIVQQAESVWQQALNTDALGLVDRCDRQGKNGLMMKRHAPDFDTIKNECSYQASYLAKERGKENKEKGTWTVSGTRVLKASSRK